LDSNPAAAEPGISPMRGKESRTDGSGMNTGANPAAPYNELARDAIYDAVIDSRRSG